MTLDLPPRIIPPELPNDLHFTMRKIKRIQKLIFWHMDYSEPDRTEQVIERWNPIYFNLLKQMDNRGFNYVHYL